MNSTTFQPGDTIAFKDGDTWTDTGTNSYYLHPQGSGTGTTPTTTITLTDYCPTTDVIGGPCTPIPSPILNGNGDGKGAAGSAGGTLYLDNQSYWNISHLEIQNDCQPACATGYRQGILIQANNVGEVSGITLQNLTVDQVTGENVFSQEAKRTGGIIFDIEGPTGPGSKPTFFNGVTITNVTVYDVSRSGIFFYSVWKGPVQGTYPCPVQPDQGYNANQWVPSTSVVVSNNTVYNIGGDGIVVTDGLKQMISYNVVYNTHKDGYPSAGIWTEDSYQATIEDNEVYNVQFNGGTIDAEAFDTDRCDIGATFEYNYSHANDGGFLLMEGYSQDTIVRYNISQNDGNSTGQNNLRYFLMNNSATTADGVQIYNNDIFSNLNTGQNPVGLIYYSNLSYSTQPFFENNLILNENPAGNCYINIGANKEPNPWLVSNNDIYGYGSQQCSYGTFITGNPEFSSPPAGDGRASAVSAYTLIQVVPAPSPAFCQGAIIGNNGSYDFNDVPLPAGVVDAGALEKGPNIC